MSKQLPPTGRRAAVIGAGPAGLTVAFYLAKKGHSVTVFDALAAAGGMARYGIPSYRIPLHVIDNEVAEVEKLGVEFRFNTRIEKIADLLEQGFETVFIGIGAQGGDKLGIPGDDLPNVVDSPTFLRAATQGKVNTPDSNISVGLRVAVIGGGNVATDNSRTSRRLGGAQVDMVYRRTRDEMPAREDEAPVGSPLPTPRWHWVSPMPADGADQWNLPTANFRKMLTWSLPPLASMRKALTVLAYKLARPDAYRCVKTRC